MIIKISVTNFRGKNRQIIILLSFVFRKTPTLKQKEYPGSN